MILSQNLCGSILVTDCILFLKRKEEKSTGIIVKGEY